MNLLPSPNSHNQGSSHPFFLSHSFSSPSTRREKRLPDDSKETEKNGEATKLESHATQKIAKKESKKEKKGASPKGKRRARSNSDSSTTPSTKSSKSHRRRKSSIRMKSGCMRKKHHKRESSRKLAVLDTKKIAPVEKISLKVLVLGDPDVGGREKVFLDNGILMRFRENKSHL